MDILYVYLLKNISRQNNIQATCC